MGGDEAKKHFNSHARVGRDAMDEYYSINLSDFNSHARVGRDAVTAQISKQAKISTHTPV